MTKKDLPKIDAKDGTSAGLLAALSAILAASCCILPPLLAAAGLGSLGAGAFLGRWSLPFLVGGVGLLAASWWVFFRKYRRVCAVGLSMRNARRICAMLIFATVVIVGLALLHGYSRTDAGPPPVPSSARQTDDGSATLPSACCRLEQS